jgi:lipoprotein-anchoring transpeptidase ErfK/SrfK
MNDCAWAIRRRHAAFTDAQTFGGNASASLTTTCSEYVMQRTILSVLFLLASAAMSVANAGSPVMNGDPSIDAAWIQLAGANPVGSNPVDPNATPATGIFRAFGGARNAPTRTMRTAAVTAAPRVHTIDPAFLPALVDDPTGERPGTIVIDTHKRYLYLVLADGKAQRYGVGVGREGFGWTGTVQIGRKAEWPTWTPPAEMRKRQPYLPVSMQGGPNNPLGARAMYLYDGGRDTLFRIHGSNEPWTIGQAVSSGCFRMRNQDVIELYGRIGIGTRVVVI